MANKLLAKSNKFIAQLVTEDRKPCVFCEKEVDDEVVFGKLYAIGNIQCHYFCVLLSCCLVQKGRDTQGLFGFMYRDILAEVERSKKHKCSYCGKGGATLGCAVSQCRKQFHLPCGRNKNAVSMFHGTYKTFCQLHVPKQQLTDEVASKVKFRKQASKALNCSNTANTNLNESIESACVCAICYEAVEALPTTDTFWPPCCARDAWLHRLCVQRMALSAGKHYFKCPLCNDKDQFFDAVMKQGYYVPDRDAAWELEQNAFAEIYERPLVCSADECKCPKGRDHDAEMGTWDVKLCLLCGSTGIHAGCVCGVGGVARFVCGVCRDIAGEDADRLATSVEAALLEEQERNRSTARSGPIMPSRMSLRRTKQRAALDAIPSSSRIANDHNNANRNTAASRETLKLKPIRKPKIISPMLLHDVELTLLSPIKRLERALSEKLSTRGMRDVVVNGDVIVDEVRRRFMKPKPRSAKRKIVDELAEGLFNNILKDSTNTKDPVIEWTSPKKATDSQEAQETPKTPCKLSKSTPSPLKAGKAMSNLNDAKTKNSPKIENCNDNISSTSSDSHITQEKQSPDDIKRDDETESNNIQLVTDEQEKSRKTPKHEKEDVLLNTPILKDIVESEKTPSLSVNVTDNIKTNDINDTEDVVSYINEDSNSTFELPKEFIADTISDDEFPITPNKLKTVDFQKDSSMEISENDEVVTVDLTQMASNDGAKKKRKKFAFKFSPQNKSLDKSELDIETFKNQYLNEVNTFNCKFKHNHNSKLDTPKIKTVIDFAIDAAFKNPANIKRKLDMNDDFEEKKIKVDDKQDDTEKMNKKHRKRQKRKLKKLRKKMGMNLSFRNKNIQLKIRIRDENLNVRIKKQRQSETKKQRQSETKKQRQSETKKMKQCVLSTKNDSPTFVRPEKDVVLKKRNYVKSDKSPDNWKQTSLSSFFVKKSDQ